MTYASLRVGRIVKAALPPKEYAERAKTSKSTLHVLDNPMKAVLASHTYLTMAQIARSDHTKS